MSQFKLFDSIKLKESLVMDAGAIAPEGSPGAIVEVFNDGEAYMVELFGGWIKAEVGQDFSPADRDDDESFMETIGVETVCPHQIILVNSAEIMTTRAELLALVDELPETALVTVRDFAAFLKFQQQQMIEASH